MFDILLVVLQNVFAVSVPHPPWQLQVCTFTQYIKVTLYIYIIIMCYCFNNTYQYYKLSFIIVLEYWFLGPILRRHGIINAPLSTWYMYIFVCCYNEPVMPLHIVHRTLLEHIWWCTMICSALYQKICYNYGYWKHLC